MFASLSFFKEMFKLNTVKHYDTFRFNVFFNSENFHSSFNVDSQDSFNADNVSPIFRLSQLCLRHPVFLNQEGTRGWRFLYRWPISLNPLCKGMA